MNEYKAIDTAGNEKIVRGDNPTAALEAELKTYTPERLSGFLKGKEAEGRISMDIDIPGKALGNLTASFDGVKWGVSYIVIPDHPSSDPAALFAAAVTERG